MSSISGLSKLASNLEPHIAFHCCLLGLLACYLFMHYCTGGDLSCPGQGPMAYSGSLKAEPKIKTFVEGDLMK